MEHLRVELKGRARKLQNRNREAPKKEIMPESEKIGVEVTRKPVMNLPKRLDAS